MSKDRWIFCCMLTFNILTYVFPVLGDVSPTVLGRTLTHEHLAMDFQHFYTEPPAPLADKFQSKPSLETIGFVRQYPYSSKYNLILNDEDSKVAVLDDVVAYKNYGGGI